MAGFGSPLPLLGLSAPPATTQGGFRTPLPGWNAGTVSGVTQGGFTTVLPFWSAGTTALPDVVEQREGGAHSESERSHGAVIVDRRSVTESAISRRAIRKLAVLAIMAINEYYD